MDTSRGGILPVATSEVNTEVDPLTCANLRAYCARYDLTYAEIARRRGRDRRSVSAALRGDITGPHPTRGLLQSILDAANAILLEREAEDAAV